MIRFTMPEPSLPMLEQITELKEQFDSFLRSEALSELFEVLKTDRDSFKNTYDFFSINKPLHPEHSRVIVPGGSLDTCFLWMSSAVRRMRGL